MMVSMCQMTEKAESGNEGASYSSCLSFRVAWVDSWLFRRFGQYGLDIDPLVTVCWNCPWWW